MLPASDVTCEDAALEPSWVVGVGASAGGLEALEEFFDAVPPDSGMAFVVVQHLSPDFKSHMEESSGWCLTTWGVRSKTSRTD